MILGLSDLTRVVAAELGHGFAPGRYGLAFRIVVSARDPGDGPGWRDFGVGHVREELPCGEGIVGALSVREVQNADVGD